MTHEGSWSQASASGLWSSAGILEGRLGGPVAHPLASFLGLLDRVSHIQWTESDAERYRREGG